MSGGLSVCGPAIPSVAIAASSRTICPGTSVTFTATPINGGTPTYVWENNGNIISGQTSATYTTTSLANNDVITCVMTSSLSNVSPTTATSPGITMSVNGPTVNTVANQIVCAGSNTAAITFAGTGATSYTWTNTNTATGLAASGTGNIAAFAVTNSTGSAITSTVTVTPTNVLPSYAYIATSSNNLSVINTTTNAVVATIAGGSTPYGVAVSLDGSRVYVTNQGSANVSVINTATNAVVATVTVGSGPYGASVSPDGSHVYVANYSSSTVSVINTTTNAVVATVAVGSRPTGVSVSPDGSRVYVANNNSSTVSIINTTTNAVTATVAVGTAPSGVSVSPDGSRVYVANNASNNVSVINTTTNAVVATVAVDMGPFGVSISPNGSRVYVTNQASATVSVINTANNAVVAMVGVGFGPLGVSVSPNGSRVYVTNQGSKTVSVINTSTNAVVATVAMSATPYSFGNFINASSGCTGTPTTFTMMVNPPCDYTWTGATSTDWATATNWTPHGIPSSTDNVIIPTTTNKPMLPATQTVANLSLTGTNKIMLGSGNLVVNAITGGSSTSYIVTDGTGALTIKNLGTATHLFPVGPSTTVYAPATITNNVNRDFTVKVGTAITNPFGNTKYVNLQWDITPSVLTGNSATLALGWSSGSQATGFNPASTVQINHYNGTAWDISRSATVSGTNPYTATASGISSFSPFSVSNVSVLSVELLSFSGKNTEGGNLLTWTTANEVNNKGFQVERLMVNGQWSILGFKTGNNKASTYQFTDVAPLNTSYYRLRQIDNDGKETLSKIISVQSKGTKKSLTAYPNPVSNVLTFDTDATNLDYTIINFLGQTVLRGRANTQNIDVSALPQGSYILKVGTEQVKFIKQ